METTATVRPSSRQDRLLRIYLQDHLAGSTALIELASRCRGNNRSSPLGFYLKILLDELQEDRELIRDLLKRTGGAEDRVKSTGAWVAEKLGRLKLNGSLVAYSDLSRLEEVEALLIGLSGKGTLLDSLEDIREDGRFRDIDVAGLRRRLIRQQERLTVFHREAARLALKTLH